MIRQHDAVAVLAVVAIGYRADTKDAVEYLQVLNLRLWLNDRNDCNPRSEPRGQAGGTISRVVVKPSGRSPNAIQQTQLTQIENVTAEHRG